MVFSCFSCCFGGKQVSVNGDYYGNVETTPLLHDKKELPQEGESLWKHPYGFILGALCVSNFLAYIQFSTIVSFFPLYARDERGMGTFGSGLVFSLFPMMTALTTPVAGGLSTCVGRFQTCVLGHAMLVIGTIWFGFSPSVTQLYISRAFQGFGCGLTAVSCQSIITATFNDNLGPAVAWREVALAFTFAFGPTIGGVLYSLLGFKLMFLFYGCLIGVHTLVIVFIWSRYHSYVPELEQDKSVDLWQLCNFDVVFAVIIGLFSYFGFGVIEPLLEPQLTRTLHISPLVVGFLYVFQGGVPAILAPFIGSWNEKYDGRYFIMIGFVCTFLMYFFFGPPPFLTPYMQNWYILIFVQIICLLLLGTASAFLLTTSYCYLSYQVMKPKSGGTPEIAASLFIFLEGFSTSVAPILCGFLLEYLPESIAPNCHPELGDEDCVTSFPYLMMIYSAVMIILIAVSSCMLWKVDYAWGKEREDIMKHDENLTVNFAQQQKVIYRSSSLLSVNSESSCKEI